MHSSNLYTRRFYFGRTLDYEVSYGNQIVITPRNYALRFRHTEDQPHHYAIIGMGLVAEDYPLYYDAMNEKGLCMAGLNFVGNAAYSAPGHDKENVAQFEFIPWLLGQCANLAEAKEKLQNLQLTDTLFNTAMPRAQLHWLIADRTGAVVVESMADGLHLYDNPVGVLTNNPPFPEQMRHLSLYQGLSPCQPENNAVPGAELPLFSRGMGAYGLPGDLSSPSRFVKAAFTRANAKSARSETAAVSQLLHIWAVWNNSGAAVRWLRASTRSPYTPAVAAQTPAPITTPPMTITGSVPCACPEQKRTAPRCKPIPCSKNRIFYIKTE